MTQHSRRRFLQGQIARSEPVHIRPPGAQAEFADLCTGCGDCARACPEGIILRHAASGQPVVDIAQGACSFCGECAQACETGALLIRDAGGWPWRANIRQGCFSQTGIACRACEDSCEQDAIRFRLMPRGRAVPEIDLASCTGCGECARICPAGAIALQDLTPSKAREVGI